MLNAQIARPTKARCAILTPPAKAGSVPLVPHRLRVWLHENPPTPRDLTSRRGYVWRARLRPPFGRTATTAVALGCFLCGGQGCVCEGLHSATG